VQSGHAQTIYLERRAVLRGSIYQPNSIVFKGNSYAGKMAFDPLPVDTKEVVLHIDHLVLEFGIYDVPKMETDLEFPFAVDSQIVEKIVGQTAGQNVGGGPAEN
jgi:hypothetical protein